MGRRQCKSFEQSQVLAKIFVKQEDLETCINTYSIITIFSRYLNTILFLDFAHSFRFRQAHFDLSCLKTE